MLNNFVLAKPIYPESLINEMNISLIFKYECNLTKKGILKITGNSAFRIFDNKKFLGYGPARAAHNFYRISEFVLEEGNHDLIIELSGYNCNSFQYLNTEPFLQAEILVNEEVIAYTGKDFDCYLNDTRIQKLTRFSYQRTFAESYEMDKNYFDYFSLSSNNLTKLECKILKDKKYLSSNINYPKLNKLNLFEVENGTFEIDENAKIYQDRYMFTEHLKIFKTSEWEIDPNDIASKLNFTSNGKFFPNSEELQSFSVNNSQINAGEFRTFALTNSKTGFISFDLECKEDSEIYFLFDEIDMDQKGNLVDITFYRNTTHNVITYKLKKGRYEHISFEPYTLKYLRIAVISGSIILKNVDLVLYENPDINNISLKFENEKLQKVADAAISTFAQNAVDILTDCPSRERAGWLCDSYFTSKAENLITGKNLVERNFLENYALIDQYPTLPKGMIPMCYPGEFPDGTFIPNWSLFYILELSDYLDRTNDKELIDLSKEKVDGILNYFSKFENEIGLLENLENWVFVEWSKANDPEYICGVNFPSNMLYSRALYLAGKLYSNEDYIKKSVLIAKTINEYSFNGEFFIDNMIRNKKNEFIKTDHITETCQYYAFYFDIATKETYPELFEKMINIFGPTRNENEVYRNVAKSNVIVGDYFRLFILLKYGLLDLANKETVDYFYEMANKTGTLWEHESTWASLNHGLTSVILNIMINIYLGIEKIDYNKKEIYIKNNFIKNEYCKLKISDNSTIINNKKELIFEGNEFNIIYK